MSDETRETRETQDNETKAPEMKEEAQESKETPKGMPEAPVASKTTEAQEEPVEEGPHLSPELVTFMLSKLGGTDEVKRLFIEERGSNVLRRVTPQTQMGAIIGTIKSLGPDCVGWFTKLTFENFVRLTRGPARDYFKNESARAGTTLRVRAEIADTRVLTALGGHSYLSRVQLEEATQLSTHYVTRAISRLTEAKRITTRTDTDGRTLLYSLATADAKSVATESKGDEATKAKPSATTTPVKKPGSKKPVAKKTPAVVPAKKAS